MADRLQVITHKGRTILAVDYTGLTPQQIVELFPSVTRMSIEKKIPLIFTDVTGTYSSPEIKTAAAKSIQDTKAALGVLHSAILGIHGIQKLIANAIVKDQFFAGSREEALDWLAKK